MAQLLHQTGGEASRGEPLPTVFRSLTEATVAFRGGEVSLIAAGSGTGKSVFALWHAIYAGVPTVYVSADSDSGVMRMRAASMLSGYPQSECYQHIKAQSGPGWEALSHLGHIQFSFDAGPTIYDIEEELAATYTKFGDMPKLIVVDNLRDVSGGSGQDNWKRWLELLETFNEIARKSGAHVMTLNHVVGEYDNGDRAIPLSGLEGKISKTPAVVLTLFKPNPTTLSVVIVKNRNGKGDPSGGHRVNLSADFERMQLV